MPAVATVASDAASLLAACVLFRALDEDTRRALALRAVRKRYAAGETVFAVGAPGHAMMAIARGTIRISYPTTRGRALVLADLGPGEMFGEVALLDGRERSATATAVTPCEVVVLERCHVVPVLRERPDVCLKLLDLLCARLRRSDERMADIAFSQLPVRLAKTILSRAGALERIDLSQSDIADMVGSARENVNRQLRAWQRRGIVDIGLGWIAIRRRADLVAIADAV
ncbi:MAG: Crp/Fnr family transcriptional regulator [Bauldia sp.]|nr:Crp/Fnr family transcriptional regulator [Bauldia sp.]